MEQENSANEPNLTFAELGLDAQMLRAVEAKGFERPSPIQRLTIPALLGEGADLIAQAQTGTGKTAAFGLPLLQLLTPKAGRVQAIILVPTRELALQVTEELISFNHEKRVSVTAIYGGASIGEQLRRLSRGVDIVVGTPGRVLDHIGRGSLDLSAISYMVLDEADEMLNMGFIEDIEAIMATMNEERRVLLFSATMPERIVRLSQSYMREPQMLRVEAQQLTTDLTDQIYFEVRESDKFDALTRIVDVEAEFYGIVFCRTKVAVDEIANRLQERGYAAEGLHGDVSQAQREKILRRFKARQANILVATDVAARGIDIVNLTHVINYSLPQDSESYVHRIGRTGRAGNAGTAITFLSPAEFRQFGYLKRDIKVDIKREELPSPQDIVAMKRKRIKDEMAEVVESENYVTYTDMAIELMGDYTPEVAMAALLRMAFKNELDEKQYPEIRSFAVDRRGTVRLFLSIGRKDGFDGRKLVGLLKRECDLRDKHISDVKVADCYSFVTVPFTDAEEVVRRLNKLRKGKRPVAEITEGARPEKAQKPRRERPTREERPAREVRDVRSAREERTPAERAAAEAFVAKREQAERGQAERGQTERPKRTSAPRTQRTTERSNDTFDWSYFERGGNSWGTERHGSRGKSAKPSRGTKAAKGGKKGGRR